MPPPPYPPLRGRKAQGLGVVHNLMSAFVAMDITPTCGSGSAAEEEDEESPINPAVGRSAGPLDSAAAADPGKATGARGAAAAAEQYGQVMDVGSFVRWLSGEPAQD